VILVALATILGGCEAPEAGDAHNRAPEITVEEDYDLEEEALFETTIEATDADGDPVRLYLLDLPPGAAWDAHTRTLSFRPDFIQGGREWTVRLIATDGIELTEGSTIIRVEDTIQPPELVLVDEDDNGSYIGLTFDQLTDDFLDSPGYAGRTFTARIQVPTAATAAEPYPVRVSLHGLGGSASSYGSSSEFRIRPHDSMNSYWWGYSENLPDGEPDSGAVPNYTQRRVLHLLEWLLANYPSADRTRVYVSGSSMGGAGSLKLGYLYGRHFAWVDSALGQTIARNHRPYRTDFLADFWGDPDLELPDSTGYPVWDRLDMTRALAETPEARNQAVKTRHGKDDPTIHFGAVVQTSPLTGLSYYEALQGSRAGHYVIWDEGGHGSSDPVLGSGWWDNGWSPIFDDTTFYQSNLAFPAFSSSSLDDDPGDGSGNGNQSWDDTSGYSGTVSTPGDTGWNGEIAGARNRSLRWDATSILDSFESFEVDLWVLNGSGGSAPQEGYPTTGDQLDGELPVTVDVTIRRAQDFQLEPGEPVRWRFDDQAGEVETGSDGSVTIPALPLNLSPTRLVLSRS
jgi:poly(3-hydroxybutyrate) depolymerase